MFRELSTKVSNFLPAFRTGTLADAYLPDLCSRNVAGFISSRYLSTTPCLRSRGDRRAYLENVAPKDEGTDGEAKFPIESANLKKVDIYPVEETFSKLFNGTPFSKVPICHIRVSKNNTIFSINHVNCNPSYLRSCGMEGFKNARKGTNIAAQATAVSFSQKALQLGFRTIRVKIQGLGPGRMSAIKGLQMGGMDIISITDDTRVSWDPPRPRKPRRL